MERTNTYTAHATSQWQRQCACEWLKSQCAHWNELTYRRRQAYFADDGDVWSVETSDLYDKYGPVTGTGTAQQLKRKNDSAWTAFFEQLDNYHNGDHEDKPSPPGYWGNRDDGYDLHGFVRNDQYTIDWNADTSTLSFTIGKELRKKYDMDYQERLTLELRGNPKWKGEDSRLELQYDDANDCFRVYHPVTVRPDYRNVVKDDTFTHTLSSGNTEQAAIDIGANNTLSIVTTTGDAAVFHARPEFHTFKRGQKEIAQLQSELPDTATWSARLTRLSTTVYGKRDHHRNAAVKQAAEWLLEHNVGTVYIGDVSGVLDSPHWHAEVNEKTHAFWSHSQLTSQLENTFELAGIQVAYVDEADSSSTCPHCGTANVARDGDEFSCRECNVYTHADVAGAGNILTSETSVSVSEWFRPMARPAGPAPGRDGRVTLTHFQWDDHEWRPTERQLETLGSLDQRSVSKPVTSCVVTPGRVAQTGIPRL